LNLARSIPARSGFSMGHAHQKGQKAMYLVELARQIDMTYEYNTFQFAHAYARGEGMKHYVNMVQEPEFAARDKGYTFVSHQQEVGVGYFDDVTTVIQGGSSSVKALTGSTEEEQFH
jgi:isocitrate lyase